jgi:hypothetical protein
MQHHRLNPAVLLPAAIAGTILLVSQQRQIRHWVRAVSRAAGSAEVDSAIALASGLPALLPVLGMLAGMLLAQNCLRLRINH